MRKFSKKELDEIHSKYNGKCAYCGCNIRKKEMQPDNVHGDSNDEDISNYMPSCFSCHRYKDEMDINEFRNILGYHLRTSCVDTFQARLALKYGMIEVKKWDHKFYFEKQDC